MKSIKRTSAGFTIIELIVVLAIISGLLAAVLSLSSEVDEGEKGKQLAQMHTMLSRSISNYYSPDFNYTGISTAVIFRLAPKAMQRGAANPLATPYGGTATVAAVTGRTDVYSIAYTGMPLDFCEQDVKLMSTNALKVEVGPTGSEVPVKDLLATAAPFELNRSLLATTCAALTGANYQVIFTNR